MQRNALRTTTAFPEQGKYLSFKAEYKEADLLSNLTITKYRHIGVEDFLA